MNSCNNKNRSCILTRDCDKIVNIRYDNLVQTNCDYDKTKPNILYSVERRKTINKIQQKINSINLNESNESIKIMDSNKILKLFLKFPIINCETIYIHYQYTNEHATFIYKKDSDNSNKI